MHSMVTVDIPIANVTWMPFFIAVLSVCVIVFILTCLISPEGMTSQTYAFPYVLRAFVGMIAGVASGTLVELLLKMVLSPTYGTLLRKRPLTVVSVFTDSEDLIGLAARIANDKRF